jgi:hypothetical protein
MTDPDPGGQISGSGTLHISMLIVGEFMSVYFVCVGTVVYAPQICAATEIVTITHRFSSSESYEQNHKSSASYP